jgi:hypothetical protein
MTGGVRCSSQVFCYFVFHFTRAAGNSAFASLRLASSFFFSFSLLLFAAYRFVSAWPVVPGLDSGDVERILV